VAKIYIAGKFERRDILRPYKEKLYQLGHEVFSTWLNEQTKPGSMSQSEFFRKLAIKDLCEVFASDIVIMDTIEMSERGGASNEYGFALGQFQSKQILIVGPKRSVFHELADRQFDTWDELIKFFETLRRAA
jgi:hypothetical protein